MLLCGLCEERFPSNDELRDHLEGHASKLFDSSDEESDENEIKTERDFDQDSDEGSLVLDCVKEEEQLQDQQEGIRDEDAKESSPFAPAEAVKKRRVLRERTSSSKERRKTIVCSKCSFKTINKKLFKEHMNIMHLNKIKCDHCPKRYPTKGSLAYHIEKEHENEDKPILPEDEFFRITMKQQGKRRLYECLKCTYKVIIRSLIYQHIRAVHREALDELYKSKGMVLGDAGYHKCTKCFYKTVYLQNLNEHIKTVHQKRRDFVCDLCKKAFPAKGTLLKHMGRTHISADGWSLQLQGQQREFTSFAPSEAVKKPRVFRERDTFSKIFLCTKCSFKTVSKITFKRHMNQMHLNKIKCDHCAKRFHSKGSLANHVREKHVKDEDKPKLLEVEFFRTTKKKQGNPNRRLHECLKCTFKTLDRSKIYRHIRGVHKQLLEELYKSKGIVLDDATYQKCTKCFYKTLDMGNLKRHIKTVHQKTRDFVCDLCKKAISTKKNLIRHMKNIHISADSLELHKCSICTYKTIRKDLLKKHLNIVHLKIRRFTCNLCRKQFSVKTNLQKHIDGVHNEKKILSCDRDRKCTFTTTDKHELLRHIRRVHEKIQGVSCEICGNWYSSRTRLFKHKKKQHLTIGVSITSRLTCDLRQTTKKHKHN